MDVSRALAAIAGTAHAREHVHHRYGDRWVTHHIPSLFRHGGQLAILPNDKWGQVEQMLKYDDSFDFAP